MIKTSIAFFPLLVAAVIVNLDPIDARFDSLTDNDDAVGGFAAVAPTAANGPTFNVTFTPAVADVNSAAQAINVMEIGGGANGSGLYLLGSSVAFARRRR